MKNYIKKMIATLMAFLLLGGLLFVKDKGMVYHGEEAATVMNMENTVYSADVEMFTECLLVIDSDVKISNIYSGIMQFILDSMLVKYDVADIAKEPLPDLSEYQTVVMAITDLSYLKEDLDRINQWVYDGGGLMNAYSYSTGTYFNLMMNKLGVIDGGIGYTSVSEIDVEDGFMIGAEKNYRYDSMDTSIALLLDSDCHVYIKDVNTNNPILWEKSYGKGKYVVVNIEEYSKTDRGVLSAAYSVLQEAFVYPVINASAYYIDDLPCPVPAGRNKYIYKDYNMNIYEYYMNIWWPRVLGWEDEYGIVHTGMIIETYNDIVEEPFQRQAVTEHFSLIGTMLLNRGGELGVHGYNHMPLCTKGFDYKGEFDGYVLWPNRESMKKGLQELMSFSESLYPGAAFSTYVPPSNVLSEEGREILANDFPNIKEIAASYLPLDNGCEYVQEFNIGEDGIINTPRIISGCSVDDYMYLVAFSELNFHYVQSHFLHPDDALDPERGAKLGWERLAELFEEYLSWVRASAPNIRNVSGLQMGQAVKEYDLLTMQKTYVEQGMNIKLGGFSGDAYLMLRINEGELDTVLGGEVEHITGNLYLIHAKNDEISVKWKSEGN
ncbi:MAG: DUF2194 domain-containing protein [Anaerotignum sp.]|nr:DUF2194 domain-containing protein [Anaerotignum sp.]